MDSNADDNCGGGSLPFRNLKRGVLLGLPSGKRWTPDLSSRTPGDFTMADLLRFVGDISLIDGITTV